MSASSPACRPSFMARRAVRVGLPVRSECNNRIASNAAPYLLPRARFDAIMKISFASFDPSFLEILSNSSLASCTRAARCSLDFFNPSTDFFNPSRNFCPRNPTVSCKSSSPISIRRSFLGSVIFLAMCQPPPWVGAANKPTVPRRLPLLAALPSIEAAGLENYWKENFNSTHRSAPNVPKRPPPLAHKHPGPRLIGVAW